MSNPVFGRIDDNIRMGGYASFGGRRQDGQTYGQTSQPQYGQRVPQRDMTPQGLEDLYDRPSAGPVQMGRLTVDDVVMKSLGLFGLLLLTAVPTGFLALGNPALTPVFLLGSVVLTLVLGLVIAFKKTVNVPLIVTYAALEGVLVGAASAMFASWQNGIVTTAIVATLSVFAAMFAGWKFGIIKVTDKSRRIFGLAILGYLFFALANFVAAWAFGANGGWGFFGFGSWMSIGISIFAVGLASYSLAMDFDSIDRAVAAQMPQKYSWLLAHGLIVTLVWLYLEMLRLVAQLSGRD